MTPDQFRQWRVRMGGLTIDQTAEVLGVSRSSVRGYGDGRRVVPDYIVKLCEEKEDRKNMGDLIVAKKTTDSKGDADVAAVMTTAYIQAMGRRNPVSAFTINKQAVEECMQEALQAAASMGIEFNATDNQATR